VEDTILIIIIICWLSIMIASAIQYTRWDKKLDRILNLLGDK